MANNIRECLDALLELDGVRGAAVVDALGSRVIDSVVAREDYRHAFESSASVDAASFLHQVSLVTTCGCRSLIESMILMRDGSTSVIVPLSSQPFVFIYLLCERDANLGRAQLRLTEIQELLVIDDDGGAAFDDLPRLGEPAAASVGL